MNKALVKIILMGLLLLLAIAPFAGLVPVMLFLLIAGVGWMLWSLLQTLWFGDAQADTGRTPSRRQTSH